MAEAAVRYEKASPALLIDEAAAPPAPQPDQRKKTFDWVNMRSHMEARIMMGRSWRSSWISHYALLARYILPRRSLWLTEGGYDQPTPNSMVRGLPINQDILDTTPIYAAQVCSAGLMSGLMSPSRPWFKLRSAGIETAQLDRAAQIWLEDVEQRIYTVMAESNFYDSAAQMFEDLTAFGTAPMLIYEDDEDIIRCQNPMVGEYYLFVGPSFRIESFARLFSLTVAQIVEQFGLDNCPVDVQELWRNKGASMDQERMIAHLIEPNFDIQPPGVPTAFGKIPGKYTYRETFWVWGASTEYPLSVRGFHDLPFIAPRCWVSGNEAYGRSFGMNVLGDSIQLQLETKRKAELLEKVVRPPLKGPIELKNQPSTSLPGQVTFMTDPSKGLSPVYEINPQGLPGITEDLKEIQNRVKTGFFNDLFLMLAQATKDMTAFEVAQRQQEKLQVLGPVIERFQNEGAGPAIKRIFSILSRKQLLPPLPKSLQGRPLQIEYVSMLAMAQRAVATAGIERLAAMIGRIAAVKPESMDLVDWDEMIREYSDQLGVSQKVMTPKDMVAMLRKQRAQAQQAAQQQQMMSHAATEITPALTQAAQNLSGTDVGGGINALQAILGNAGGSQGAL
jgi:Bacteriophage head to tail connecting protein